MEPKLVTIAPGVFAVQKKYKSYKGHYCELPVFEHRGDLRWSDSDSDSDDGYGGGYGAYGLVSERRGRSKHPYETYSHKGNPGQKTVRFMDSEDWKGNTLDACFDGQESDALLKPRYGWD
jgi:hypothetical protein